MKSTPGFQDLVRKFDKKYWQHKPGPDSIKHTYFHLMIALGRTLPSREHRPNPEYTYEQLAGRLLEHAARIANNCGIRSAFGMGERIDSLFVELRGTTVTSRSINLIAATSAPVPSKAFFVRTYKSLAELAAVCERLDHNGQFIRRDRDDLCTAVQMLLESACDCGPLARMVLEPDTNLPEIFLEPLQSRIKTLELRHTGGVPTEQVHQL